MKKSDIKTFTHSPFVIVLICFGVLLAAGCSSRQPSGPDPDPIPDPGPDPVPPADTLDPVAADGILETVTWNLEWYGNTGQGPSDEALQTSNALVVFDSLRADLYALQEISDQEALDNLTVRMQGYRGFIAEEQPRNQHTAFIFNSNSIDSLSSGLITEGQDAFDWASGRLPFFFRFNYRYPDQDVSIPVLAVVIHAKASTDEESYQRRMRAAESLYNYLQENEPETNIVFLGDYNDDVDESIYQGAETPYDDFVEDVNDFFVVTQSLSEEGTSSTTGYPDIVDHITVSNEMEVYYQSGSETAFQQVESFIDQYEQTTSDHYPVWATFDIR